jgi:Rps23 Pro-64 3,4-dihydroxylase Tpa1-like proline 4-hydroxylase
MTKNILANILIAPDVVTKEGLDFILDYTKNQPRQDLSVFDPHRSNETKQIEFSVEKDIRDTQIISIDPIRDEVIGLYKNIVDSIINPFYQFEIRDSEFPQLLCYGPGGHYKPHYDGVSTWKAPGGEIIWRKSTDRDLSTVLFLNDDFEGGDFVFPQLRIRIRPEPGLLVCFPSDNHYLHGVESVSKGERFSMVTWMTVKGFPSMAEETKIINARYGIK